MTAVIWQPIIWQWLFFLLRLPSGGVIRVVFRHIHTSCAPLEEDEAHRMCVLGFRLEYLASQRLKLIVYLCPIIWMLKKKY